MGIIVKYPETINKATLYAMTAGKQAEKMSAYSGEELIVKAYVKYNSIDKDTGEEKIVLSVLTDDNRILSTVSKSFIEEFDKITEIWAGEELPKLTIIQGTSAKGHEYITCGVNIIAV